MKSSVITDVIRHDHTLCIGCGICAALCPQGSLEMAWNQYGEYNPRESTPCITECGLCLKVCPFADNEENEDTIGKGLYGGVPGISHRHEIGYYLAAYVGYAEKHRLTSASGGVATWLLEKLLAEGIVDHVVCVAPTGNPGGLFSFMIFETPDGVRTGAGSAYYPVEMSGVIRKIMEMPGRYAVTGLPCFIKAIRLAQKKNTKLRERIAVTIGLVCGQMKSKHFTDYIAALAEVRGRVIGVRYRGKSPEQPASNYHYAFKTENCEEKRIYWREGISEAWTNRWFTPNACDYCDDVFAECADVTCMDAWLPEYSKDFRGTSLVLVRSQLVEEIITGGVEICLNSIPVELAIQSQSGIVAIKRQHLSCRLYLGLKEGLKIPKKRVLPEKPKNPFLWREVILKNRMSIASKDIWSTDRERFRDILQPVARQLAKEKEAANLILSPIKAIKNISDKINRGSHHE